MPSPSSAVSTWRRPIASCRRSTSGPPCRSSAKIFPGVRRGLCGRSARAGPAPPRRASCDFLSLSRSSQREVAMTSPLEAIAIGVFVPNARYADNPSASKSLRWDSDTCAENGATPRARTPARPAPPNGAWGSYLRFSGDCRRRPELRDRPRVCDDALTARARVSSTFWGWRTSLPSCVSGVRPESTKCRPPVPNVVADADLEPHTVVVVRLPRLADRGESCCPNE